MSNLYWEFDWLVVLVWFSELILKSNDTVLWRCTEFLLALLSRPMVYVEMIINLTGDSLANRDELELKWQLSDLIESRDIGKVIGSGSGLGQMDIGVEVDDLQAGKSKLRQLAEELGVEGVQFDS